MAGLFDGTPLERPVTCEHCGKPAATCPCPKTAAGAVLLPKDQPARVRREKRNGKFVTVVAGLDPAASDAPGLLKRFRASLGAGGTFDKATGNIELQGDHRDKIVAALIAMGYPAKAAGG